MWRVILVVILVDSKQKISANYVIILPFRSEILEIETIE